MLNLSPLKIKVVSILKRVIGRAAAQRLIEHYYIRTYRKRGLIFVHIPKSAGTSIASIIYGNRNGHLKAIRLKEKMGDEFEKFYSFAVCRNPYERLASAYAFAKQGTTRDGAIAQSNIYKGADFRSFEVFITNWLVHQDLENSDPVFQPQHLFVFNGTTLLVDRIFKLEDLEKLENGLSELLLRKITIGNKNKSRRDESLHYTEEMKEIVYKLYKKDFQLFNYQR